MERLTREEIEALPTEVLTCQQIAPILGANPATIHGQATDRPELLGFPVIVAGRRVRIPRRVFAVYAGRMKKAAPVLHTGNGQGNRRADPCGSTIPQNKRSNNNGNEK